MPLTNHLDPTSGLEEESVEFEPDDFLPSERKSMKVFRKLRWKDGVKCPRCKSENTVKFGSGTKDHVQRYRCNSCDRYFNDLTGSIFEGAKIGIREWLYTSKRLLEGASMNQIAEELERDYNTIMRIRDLVSSELGRKLMAELEEEVEIDETYVSSGQKGTKCEERPPRERGLKLRGRGTYDEDKPPILALVERGGKIILNVAEELSNKFARKILGSRVEKGSKVYHDSFSIYDWLPDYVDFSINKEEEGYVKGEVHINTVEGLFSLLESWLRTFRGVRKDNLWKFLKIFEFKHNFRAFDPFQKLRSLMSFILPP